MILLKEPVPTPEPSPEEMEPRVSVLKQIQKVLIRSIIIIVLVGLLILGIIVPLRVGPQMFSSLPSFLSLKNFGAAPTTTLTVIPTSTTTVSVPIIATTSTTSTAVMPIQIMHPEAISNYNTTSPNTSTNTNNATADLSISLIKFGTQNASGQITATQTIRRSDRLGIQFDVKNVGSTTSSTWYFTATLPSTAPGAKLMQSKTQMKLGAGSGIISTLGVGSLVTGSSTVTITIYPSDSSDSSVNNTIQIPVTIY